MDSPTNDNTSADNPRRCGARVLRFGDDEARQMLEGKGALLNDPRAGGWEMVKHNASRTVFRGCIDGLQVYLKQFHAGSLWKRICCALGVCDARRELEISARLRSRGVRASRVLAAAWGRRDQWVLTEAVSPAEPADRWHRRCLADGGPADRINAASRSLARLVAAMHSAGVVHGDLHCGNVMVLEQSPGGAVDMVLMDLHRASWRRWLSRGARAANLAQLCHDRMGVTTRSQRLRFLRQYLRFSGVSGSLRGWHLLVDSFVERHARRQYAHRDRRIRGNNRYFARIAPAGMWRGHVVLATKPRIADSPAARATFSCSDWREALGRPEALLAGEGVLVVKDSPSGRVVRRRLTVGADTIDVFVKLARRRGWVKTLVDCFRPSRALRGFAMGHMLLTRRFATPLPLAAIEKRRGPLLIESILITEASDAPRISDFLQESLAERSGALAAHRAMWRAGRMLRRLHDIGLAHRDLKASNLLVPSEGQGEGQRQGEKTPIMVDLDGLSRPPFLTVRRRLANLTRLEIALLELPRVTHTGRLRALLGYLLRPGAARDGFKIYWRVMERAAARKMRFRRPRGDSARRWS